MTGWAVGAAVVCPVVIAGVLAVGAVSMRVARVSADRKRVEQGLRVVDQWVPQQHDRRQP